jgi:hypothetical protein
MLFFSGSIASGYHLLDDHEIIDMHQELQGSAHDFGNTVSEWVKKDLGKRLRPFYFVHRLIEARLFGANLEIWSCYQGFLAVLTSFFLFLFFRLHHAPLILSLAFPFVTLLGPQTQIWWCLGPAEVPGILLFSLSLVLLWFSARRVGPVRLWRLLFLVTVLIMSLCKESFILIIPFIIVLFVLVYRWNSQLPWIQTLKQTLFVTVPLAIFLIVELGIIAFVIGTSGEGYAGIDHFNPIEYVQKVFLWSAEPPFIGVLWCALSVFVINIAVWAIKSRKSDDWKHIVLDLVSMILVALLIIVPQVVLYSKSGLFYSYHVPLAFGYSLLLFPLFYSHARTGLIPQILVLLCILTLLLPTLKWCYGAAKYFARQGNDINSALTTVKYSTSAGTPILIVADPILQYEQTYSVTTNLNYIQERKYLYIDTVFTKEKYDDFQTSLIPHFARFFDATRWIQTFQNSNKFGCIIIFPDAEPFFLNQHHLWFETGGYSRRAYENFILYVKNC